MPLIDYFNHSFEPNCAVIPYHDKLTNQSFVLVNSTRDIAAGE